MKENALVIGLGISGRAALQFLLKGGYSVSGVDVKNLSADPEIEKLRSSGVEIFSEKEFPSNAEFSLAVVSPGLSFTNPIIQLMLEKQVKIVSEVELGFSGNRQKTVAITGTNGKTTVTSLVEHVLNSSGRKAKAIGNIGFPVTGYFLNPDPDEILVVELSSYQLETVNFGGFDAAVLLNITPDHLDRYDDFTQYAKAKANVALCLKSGGELYVDSETAARFSSFFIHPFKVIEEEAGSLPGLPSMPRHDEFNALAAFALCRTFGVSSDEFLKGLASFKKPAHRIEFIREIRGVAYYDDSKGTNVDAVIQAVRSMKGEVVLIAGGVDKGSSYLPWKEAFTGKVKKLLLMGQAALKIYEELSLFFNVEIVDSLECAVARASEAASEGDAVLLSPGCSSFDMFVDYAHRGREFQKFVGLLDRRESK